MRLTGQKDPRGEFHAFTTVAKGCIDLRAAIEIAEPLTPPREFARDYPIHASHLRPAEMLSPPTEKRRKCLWKSIGAVLLLAD